MFTGIITHIGKVRKIQPGTDTRIEIESTLDVGDLEIGASVACSGPCLTVVLKGRDGGQSWFAVDISAESLARTTVSDWTLGHRVNLEKALCLGDELGGHMVSGHVDGIAVLRKREPVGDGDGSVKFTIEVPQRFARFIAEKGSVALDGVSLTVNDVEDTMFTVNIIPHTLEVSTLGDVAEGTQLNFEVDIVARYVDRLGQF